MGAFCINVSGDTYPVYDNNGMENKIGSIATANCFSYIETWAGSHVYYPSTVDKVYYKNSNTGAMETGWILNDGSGVVSSYLKYSFGSVTVSGVAYKSFKTRSALKCYNKSGTYVKTAVSGARVLTNDSTPGATMPYLMQAMYVETGVGTNVWTQVSDVAGEHGFVDTNLRSSSAAFMIGVYGNW